MIVTILNLLPCWYFDLSMVTSSFCNDKGYSSVVVGQWLKDVRFLMAGPSVLLDSNVTRGFGADDVFCLWTGAIMCDLSLHRSMQSICSHCLHMTLIVAGWFIFDLSGDGGLSSLVSSTSIAMLSCIVGRSPIWHMPLFSFAPWADGASWSESNSGSSWECSLVSGLCMGRKNALSMATPSTIGLAAL